MVNQPKIGIGIWVIHEEKLLLGKRIGALGENSWAPPGGHLEFGEDPVETVHRELLEETSLEAKTIEPLFWTHEIYEKEHKHYVSLHYLVTDFSGQPQVMEPNKCLEWQWVDLGNYPKPLFKAAQNFLEQVDWEKYLRYVERNS